MISGTMDDKVQVADIIEAKTAESGYRRSLAKEAAVKSGQEFAWYRDHAYNVSKFMLVNSRLDFEDRKDLEGAAGHIKWSAITGSAFCGYLAGSSATYMNLLTLKLCKGAIGAVVGFNVGLELAYQITGIELRNRPECLAAMALMKSYPAMSAWERFYGGDKRALLKIIPEAEHDPMLVKAVEGYEHEHAIQHPAATCPREKWRKSDGHMRDGAYDRVCRYANANASNIAGRFADSYAVYLSNDYRRPFSDRSQ